MGNTQIKNIKYVYKQHLNKKAKNIIEIANVYYENDNKIIRDALIEQIKRNVGTSKQEKIVYALTHLDNINDFTKHIANDNYYLTTRADAIPEAIDFANAYFSNIGEPIIVDAGNVNGIRITRKYGIKKAQVSTMFGISAKEADILFHNGDFMDLFVGKYMRKRILDCVENSKSTIFDNKSKIKVVVGDANRVSGISDKQETSRFININVDFIIPIEALDTFTLSTIVVLIHKIENIVKEIIG